MLSRSKCWITPLVGLLFVSSCAALQPPDPEQDTFSSRREAMVAGQLAARDIDDERVLKAMREVPRHLFVPESMREFAYQDRPLPIGLNQTISQPYIVAFMTQLANPDEEKRALEVGTGSGYQAAVLSRLVKEVYTIEIISELAERARKTLQQLGYRNVHVRQGDGYMGWPEQGPFDIVLVTAAAGVIPEPLIDQLAEGGHLVIPVGEVDGVQVLTHLTKTEGKIKKENVMGVRFVPMTGKIRQEH